MKQFEQVQERDSPVFIGFFWHFWWLEAIHIISN